MRQRNDTGHVLPDVMAWPTDEHPDQQPFGVGIGEVIDYPTLLGGFTSLEPDPEPEPGADGAESVDAEPAATGDDQAPEDAEAGTADEQPKTRRTRKAAAATQPEGGEQQ